MSKFKHMFSDIKYFFYYSFDLVLIILALLIRLFSINGASKISIENSKKPTLILCNGPSLFDDINWITKHSDAFDISVVHYFAITDYFADIKPKYYFIADAMFWRDDISKEFHDDIENLFRKLNKVNWEMTIVCPLKGLEKLKNKINNKFIKFQSLRHWSLNYNSEIFSILSLRLNLTTPFFCTVAVMALWHAILRRRNKIYLYGFDFSIFKEYEVDQETNELNNSSTHFYKNQKSENKTHIKYLKRPKSFLNHRLYKNWLAFQQMYFLSIIAESRKLKVFNSSSNSYLDCFCRENLKDIL